MNEIEFNQMMKRNPSLKIAGAGKSNTADRIPTQPQEVKSVSKAKNGSRGKQTKCEMEYGRMLAFEFPGCEVEPFGITLRLANGHKYTPDFIVKDKEGIKLICECKQRGKNGFRQHSYQRAKVMFDQSRVEYPFWLFRWAEKQSGIWNISNF